MSTAQLDLFEEAEVEVTTPDPVTSVKLGNRERRINLAKKRRETLRGFMRLLPELEGKDIYIGTYGGHGGNYWLHTLKLGRLKVEAMFGDKEVPSVIVLRGNRAGEVRIFTDQVFGLRCQEYFGYTLWLLDFWNGFGEYPIDRYRQPGCDSLHITRFKD